MEKAHRDSQTETYTKAYTIMASRTDMESTIGQTVVILKDISKMDFEMVKEYGKRVRALTKNTRANTQMIRNKATVFLLGLAAMYIRAIT